jgi:hypothetical protein
VRAVSTDPFMLATGQGKPFQRSGSSLLGPADADHFRIKVGRYGDRWYCDPLPGDRCWAAWDGSVPSISTIKKASGSDWSFVALKRVNEALEQRPTRFDGMSAAERYEALKAINKLGLSAAAQRGTNVHLYCEAKLHGSDWRIPVGAPGHEYMPAVDAWFDQHQPELIAAEYVVIKRQMFCPLSGEYIAGYGGTPDGLLRIDGLLWAIDWKSRGEDSEHGAYPEEAEQVAAGVIADYMIVQGDHGAERQEIPDVTGGLIVSIRPDGARSYPIDISDAAPNWRARHAWWTARLRERKPVGKPWPIKGGETPTFTTPYAALPDRAANLVDRLRTVAALSPDVAQRVREAWPAGCPKLSEGGHTDEQLDRIQQIVEQAETITSAPFSDIPAEPAPLRTVNVAEVRARVVPDEGEPASEGRMVQMRELHAALDDVQRAWIAALADQSRAVASFHLAERKTTRSTCIVRGLIGLAQNDCMDDDLVRAAAAFALDSDEPLQASTPPGAAIAALGWTEALTFLGACAAFVKGGMDLAFDDNGVMRLVDRPLTADQAAERLGGTWA